MTIHALSEKERFLVMAAGNFYTRSRSARRPLGLSNHSKRSVDDALNLSDVIRNASAATDNGSDSDLSCLESDSEHSFDVGRRPPPSVRGVVSISSEPMLQESYSSPGLNGSEMYHFHSTPQSSPASVSSHHQTSMFDLLQKQSELIAQLLKKHDDLSQTVAVVHHDLNQTKDALSRLVNKDKENEPVPK